MNKKIFGIIGNPVDHSLSPILHKYWFKKYDINATYELFEVEEKNLKKIADIIRNNKKS